MDGRAGSELHALPLQPSGDVARTVLFGSGVGPDAKMPDNGRHGHQDPTAGKGDDPANASEPERSRRRSGARTGRGQKGRPPGPGTATAKETGGDKGDGRKRTMKPRKRERNASLKKRGGSPESRRFARPATHTVQCRGTRAKSNGSWMRRLVDLHQP